MAQRVDRGDDETMRGFLPLIYFSFSLITPLYLLISRFDLSRFSDVIRENSGIIAFTFFQAFVSASIVILIGVPLSRILARKRMNPLFKSVLNVMSRVPFVVPGISMALGFILLFGRNGLINLILRPFHVELNILYTFAAVVLGHVFYNVPVVLYILGTVWEKFDGSLIESAMIDGASEREILFKVEIPNLLPAILSSFLLAFVYSFTSFAVVLTLGGVKYSTVEVAIYMYLKTLLDFDSAVSLSIFQMSVLSLVALSIHVFRRSNLPSGKPLKVDMKIGDWIFLCVVAFFTISPLILSILGGFMDGIFRFTLQNFSLLAENITVLRTSFSKILTDTFSLAVVAASIAATVSVLNTKGPGILNTLSMVPSGISTVTLAFAYVLLRMRFDMGEFVSICLVHSLISLPMVNSIIENTHKSINPSILEAASIDGAGGFSRFIYVEFPMMFKGIIRAFTLSMAISMSDLSGVLTLSRKIFTLSSAVYRLSSSRHFREALALNTILITLVIAIFSLGEFTSSRDVSSLRRSRNRHEEISLHRDIRHL